MAIAYTQSKITTKFGWYSGDSTLTVTLDSAPNENDLMLLFGKENFQDSGTTTTLPSGFTEIENIDFGNGDYFVGYKFAGASESASQSTTTTNSNSGNDAVIGIIVFSGVDTTTPFDVTYDAGLHFTHVPTGGTTFDTNSISAVTANTEILTVLMGVVFSGGPIALTAPTGYTEHDQGGFTNDWQISFASKSEAAPGNKTPADWSLSPSSARNLGWTFALRESGAIYVEINDVIWEPPTGYSYVEHKGGVIPQSSILHLSRGSHTGTSGATLTDSAKTLAADEWKDYRVYNFTDDSTGIIGTHSAGSGPLTLSTALSGGTDNDFDNGDSYDITTPFDSGDQIGYVNTESGTSLNVYSFDYYLIDASDGSATSDSTASVIATGLPANKTGTISLTINGSPTLTVTGDIGGGGMSAVLGDNILGEGILGDISSASGGGSGVTLSGTATTADEADIRSGGQTIILTLATDTWVASGATFDGQRQHILDGLDAATSPANGWNNEVRDKAPVTDVVRTSDTVVTITLSAQSGYNITATETITATIPASALVTSPSPIVATPTFNITIVPVAAVGGTVPNELASTLASGGDTLTITLTGDTWAAAGTGPIGSTADTQALIDGITSNKSELTGWNNEVRDNLVPATHVARTSDTVCTITLPASSLSITETETVTPTIPAAVLVTYGSAITGQSFNVFAPSTGGDSFLKDLPEDLVADMIIDTVR